MKKLVLLASLFIVFGLAACDNETTIQETTTTYSFDQASAIKVYTRDTTSGTREAFFKGIDFDDAVEDNAELVSGYLEVDGNGSMISSISGDEYGIGYVSLSSLDDSGLTGLNFEGVEATIDNVLNNTYGLKRPFMYMTRIDWTGMETEEAIVEAFLAFMFTVEGKAIIADKGGIIESSSTDVSWDDIKANYSVCDLDNSEITIRFGGSTSVEKVAKGLSEAFSVKCGNFIADHNHTGSGDAYKRVQGTEADGANKLHIGFASRDFKDSEPGATDTFGQICWDAVVVVVNPVNNSLINITAEQIKKIYAGDVTTWNEISA
ncbi:MAG: substrate-binding domain-containing protein [Tenericutes bacterium]|nr:substrate-binding domain-containing protein [Mycoplasmatota bacterium]